MASRPLVIASLLGASIGVPYVASKTQQSMNKLGAAPGPPVSTTSTINNTSPLNSYATPPVSISQQPIITSSQGLGNSNGMIFPPQTAQHTAAVPAQNVAMSRLPSPAEYPQATSPIVASMAPASSGQFSSPAQVLRFDVTKEWVLQNWERKSTGPTDVGLFAIRVPLVMGTQMSALAGALTYFFNSQGQVEHISFRGKTGDATPLIQYLTQSYKFQAVSAPIGEKVYRVADGEAIFSELRLRPEAVLRSNTPQQSVAVELEFARPGSKRVLPPRDRPLEIPQVAGASPTEAPVNAAANQPEGGSANTAEGSYFDRVRYANPAEESKLLRNRWPN